MLELVEGRDCEGKVWVWVLLSLTHLATPVPCKLGKAKLVSPQS